jgi:Tfp pilus assembly protein PilN
MLDQSASINLAKSRVNIVDEILRWALSVGRLLVIITEFVAFSTFVYRFSLDRTIIDLHTKVKQQQAIVASIEEREATYRNLQDRLFVAKDVAENGSKNVKLLNEFVSAAPSQISFKTLSLDSSEVSFDANASSMSSLSSFLEYLRSHKEISSVSIERIENDTAASQLSVTIVGTLNSAPQEVVEE